ncbi:Hypp3724 [Branchiostoma lanceolatum]|uniref:Hypp3724 protein n=1 Tax=Branchiostoma lanceolatum TaxID=7740 RepID=A0A8K0A123_BRALA|nr:Hypp3724 [Branchiostoma lanceolatum]
MSGTTPQYWLEYTFTASENCSLKDLVTGTANALTTATSTVGNGKVLFLFKVLILVKMTTPDMLDNLFTAELPFFKQIGNQAHTTCKAIVPFQY